MTPTRTRHYESVHLGVVVSGVREDFLCQARVSAAMLLIFKGLVEMGAKGDVEPWWALLSM